MASKATREDDDEAADAEGITAEAFADLLKPFAVSRSFISYRDEAQTIGESRLVVDDVAKHHDLLMAIKPVKANLSIAKLVWKSELAKVALLPDLKLRKEDKKDWIEVLTARGRNMCRAVQQAELKVRGTAPTWIQELPWNKQKAASSDGETKPRRKLVSKTPATEVAKPADDMIYTFDTELLVVTSAPCNQPKAREFSIPLSAEALRDHNPLDPLPPKWDDGEVHTFPEHTVGEFRALVSGRGRKQEVKTHWIGQHVATHNAITVQQRLDRCLLLSMYEQNSQVLQVRLDLFGEIENQFEYLPDDSPILIRGLRFIDEFATDYCRDKIVREKLVEVRDAKLKTLGLFVAHKPLPKRKADASSPAPAPPKQKRVTWADAVAEPIEDTGGQSEVGKGKGKGKATGKSKGKGDRKRKAPATSTESSSQSLNASSQPRKPVVIMEEFDGLESPPTEDIEDIWCRETAALTSVPG